MNLLKKLVWIALLVFINWYAIQAGPVYALGSFALTVIVLFLYTIIQVYVAIFKTLMEE